MTEKYIWNKFQLRFDENNKIFREADFFQFYSA